jgi:hypothetical protein
VHPQFFKEGIILCVFEEEQQQYKVQGGVKHNLYPVRNDKSDSTEIVTT